MPNASDIEKRLDLACRMADAVRDLTLSAFAQRPSAINKNINTLSESVFDPVTEADKQVERELRAGIMAAFPRDTIIGEEYGTTQGDNDWTWCLDPIDGTRAFIAGVPVWSTLIAISYKGDPIIGLIDHPALGLRYIGVPGTAWKEADGGQQKLSTRPCTALDTAILSCTEPMAMFSEAQSGAYERIRRLSRFTRLGLDAYGYALTAEGRIDLVVEAALAPYDIQAHIPILQGAGGIITSWDGGPATNGGAIVCVGDKRLLEQVYEVLNGYLPDPTA